MASLACPQGGLLRMPESVTSEEEATAAGLLAALVRIPSVNPRNKAGGAPPLGEARMAEFVARYAEGLGAQVEMDQVVPGRPNVYCTWGSGELGLLLETHLDTVGVEGMEEPFGARVSGRRLRGRGACDAKGSLAAMLLACGMACDRLDRGLMLAAVVDEEHGFRGAKALLQRKPQPGLVVVGEPTQLKPVTVTKGCVRFRVTVRGKGAHTCAGEAGTNAVVKACKVIGALYDELAPRLRRKQHPLVGPATLAVTIIRGGAEVNVVPAECTFHVDRRLVPGETAQEALAEVERLVAQLRERDQELEVLLEPPYLLDPALEQSLDSPGVRSFLEACEKVLGEATPTGVAFGTDASKFAQAGLAALVFGPGDVAQAHGAEEWVDLREVALAARVYAEAALTV